TLRVSTNQIIATIEITQEANPGLRDRTSREGLIDTPAYHDLKALVLAALSMLEEDRYGRRKAAAPPPPAPGEDAVLAWLGRARADGASGSSLKTAVETYRNYKREADRREEVLLRVASAGAAAENLLGPLNGSVSALMRVLRLLRKQYGDSQQLVAASQQVTV